MKGMKKKAKNTRYIVLLTALSAAAAMWLSSCGEGSDGPAIRFKSIHISYPDHFRDSMQADSFHGVVVRDPYRWMEQQRDRRLAKWIQDQRSIAGQYFKQIDYRNAIRERLGDFSYFERYQMPERRGDQYFVWKNNGRQEQDVLCKTTGMFGKLQPLLDPNTWEKSGSLSAASNTFSRDGSLLAYGVSRNGSALYNIFVMETASGRKLSDTIRNVKNSNVAWFRDGFFYSRYPANGAYLQVTAPNHFHQLYFHRIGEKQSQDALVFADRSYPLRNILAETTDDERYLVLFLEESVHGSAVFFRDLEAGDGDFTPITESFDHTFRLIGNLGSRLLFLTTHNAPNGRIVEVNAGRPGERYWDDIVPNAKDAVLQHAVLAGNKLVCAYARTEGPQIAVFDLKGKPQHQIDLELHTSVLGLEAQSDSKEVFVSLGHFLQPTRIAWLHMDNYKFSSYFAPKIDLKDSQFEIQKVRYESFDGQQIPMWIIHKKGLALDGKRPTLLVADGGGHNAQPEYTPFLPLVVENEGVYAVACIRGGGEDGETWRQWGSLGKKQNAFDDFQAAAQYLVSNLYTSKEKLAIMGRGHGALIVSGTLTQRPDLCQVAVPINGIYDMMRYQHFNSAWLWAGEFGRSEVARQFDNLLSYSPLHNAVPAKYPAVLIAATDADDIVTPAHAYKLTATLQAMQQNDNPVLIRLDRGGPYPAGVPATRRLDEAADIAAFIWYNLQENLSTPRR
ncbi:MAG: S9 family peptidase [Saprospiraceae bacterium]|nr:S9 family peptidase [Saprospiraceae bacterium]